MVQISFASAKVPGLDRLKSQKVPCERCTARKRPGDARKCQLVRRMGSNRALIALKEDPSFNGGVASFAGKKKRNVKARKRQTIRKQNQREIRRRWKKKMAMEEERNNRKIKKKKKIKARMIHKFLVRRVCRDPPPHPCR